MKKRRVVKPGTLHYPPYYRLGRRTVDLLWCPRCFAGNARLERVNGQLVLRCITKVMGEIWFHRPPCEDTPVVLINTSTTPNQTKHKQTK